MRGNHWPLKARHLYAFATEEYWMTFTSRDGIFAGRNAGGISSSLSVVTSSSSLPLLSTASDHLWQRTATRDTPGYAQHHTAMGRAVSRSPSAKETAVCLWLSGWIVHGLADNALNMSHQCSSPWSSDRVLGLRAAICTSPAPGARHLY
jgi:hypothetical protein